jgi:hypothetical protein
VFGRARVEAGVADAVRRVGRRADVGRCVMPVGRAGMGWVVPCGGMRAVGGVACRDIRSSDDDDDDVSTNPPAVPSVELDNSRGYAPSDRFRLAEVTRVSRQTSSIATMWVLALRVVPQASLRGARPSEAERTPLWTYADLSRSPDTPAQRCVRPVVPTPDSIRIGTWGDLGRHPSRRSS